MTSLITHDSPFNSESLNFLFNELDGYYNLGNRELAGSLIKWGLLEESNRASETMAYNYIKWSLTVSFLELINSLQWFLAGVLLYRKSYLINQVLQMNYYSIFFSYGSFLASHGKGHYTVQQDFSEKFIVKSYRKMMWFENHPSPHICLKDKGRGGEHELRAKWFYEVFKKWDNKNLHPSVMLFENEANYHSNSRNESTYSLFNMAEELHHSGKHNPEVPTNDMLIELWNGNEELVDIYTEDFWVLAHLKVPLELHIRLLENCKIKSPYKMVQNYLIETLLSRHENTGMKSFLCEILKPILVFMKIKTD